MNYQTPTSQTRNSQSEIAITQIVDLILSRGRMSRQDHTLLTSTVFVDNDISDVERRQINRIFDYIQTGRLQLVDW